MINKSVSTTVRLSPTNSELFNQAARQMGLSKADLMTRCTLFVLANKDDQNEFLAPESLLKNILERFTKMVEERAIERGLLTADGTLSEVSVLASAKKYFSDRAALETANNG